jgi:endonuclease I
MELNQNRHDVKAGYIFLLTCLFLLRPFEMFGQIPSGYYSTATGTGFTLKTQLYNKIKNHTVNSYNALWTIYSTTDRDNFYENDNSVLDIYSENPAGVDAFSFIYSTNQCGSYTAQGQCYNREHIIPQSIYSSSSPMVSDAHCIVPTDGYTNQQRDNYPHANVATASFTSFNGSKKGTSALAGYTGTVFEPINEFKGDVARMYFYFVTRYENLVANYANYPMFNGTSTQSFTTLFMNMLLSWHTQDPVSAKEVARNNAVYAYQLNRNPFIDHPEYVSSIWGTSSLPLSQTITFNALSALPYSSTTMNLSATASSGLTVSYTSSNTSVATIVGSIITIQGVGTSVITASQNGNPSYNAATPVNQNLTITQATQAITFNSLPSKQVGDTPFTLSATGGLSGISILYTSSNPLVATVAGNLVTIVGIGTTNITASQAGNSNYAAASSVVQALQVNQATSSSNPAIATWDFNTLPGGTSNFGPSPFAPNFANTNAIVGGLIRGNGIATNLSGAARAWGGVINTATSSTAITSNAAITFTLKPAVGFAIDLSSIDPLDYRRSSSGATNALLQFKINNGAYTNITTINFPISTSSGGSIGSIPLSTFASLQNIHASQEVTFRLLPYGGTGGTFYLFDKANSTASDFALLGLVKPCTTSTFATSISISANTIPYNWNGQSLSTSGTYTAMFINSAGCDSIATLNLTIVPTTISFGIKAFIEGYYANASTMLPVLQNQGIGSNPLAVDTIMVSLHQPSTPYNVLYSCSSLIATNGNINCSFPSSTSGNNYYIVLNHRNSVETWSANPVMILNNNNYDFTTTSANTFGSNQIQVGTGIFAIYSGDINQDGIIDNSDFSIWEIDANNFMSGYVASDLNGDGTVDNTDFAQWELNANNFVGEITP